VQRQGEVTYNFAMLADESWCRGGKQRLLRLERGISGDFGQKKRRNERRDRYDAKGCLSYWLFMMNGTSFNTDRVEPVVLTALPC
jgi:hypothetical protein